MEWIVLKEDEMLVSFDVKSLFTSIPVSEAIEICERRLRVDKALPKRTSMDVDTIMLLVLLCLNNTSFLYGGQPYQQPDGVAMGSPLSPIIADIFMVDLEEKAIAGAGEDIAPSVWKRYVDDVLSVVKRDKGQLLLDHLNKQHEKIRFTMEEERDGSLPFTDISFSRDEYGQVVREVYRKPTHTNRYVQFTSHHPESVKSGVIDCLVKRAATVSSNDELLGKELDKIREAMNQNNYPKHFVEKAIEKGMRRRKMPRLLEQELDQGETTAKIPFIDGLSQEVRRIARTAGVRCAFFAPSTTRPLYSVKDKLPHDLTTNAIYSIKCKTCDDEYVGETLRAIQVRAKEHRDAIRLGNTEKSAVAQHVHQQKEPHEIDWSTMSVIDKAQAWRERKLREAFKIHQRQPKMNRDAGLEHPKTWHSIL